MPTDHTTTYQSANGAPVTVPYVELRDSHVNYAAKREHFCRLMSTGAMSELEAYGEAWGKPLTGATEAQLKVWKQNAMRIANEAHVRLRIDQLKTPVVRKFAKKFEYTLQKAFEQCEEAYNLARIESDAKSMLKAVELQGKFAKLLADQLDVNHRIGVLDDASTESLLAMLAMVQRKRQSGPKIVGDSEAGGVIDVAEGAHGPALVPSVGPT